MDEAQHAGELEEFEQADKTQEAEEGCVANPPRVIKAVGKVDTDCHKFELDVFAMPPASSTMSL